jgi:hypothetical protein
VAGVLTLLAHMSESLWVNCDAGSFPTQDKKEFEQSV